MYSVHSFRLLIVGYIRLELSFNFMSGINCKQLIEYLTTCRKRNLRPWVFSQRQKLCEVQLVYLRLLLTIDEAGDWTWMNPISISFCTEYEESGHKWDRTRQFEDCGLHAYVYSNSPLAYFSGRVQVILLCIHVDIVGVELWILLTVYI